jgi:hypothetical protein
VSLAWRIGVVSTGRRIVVGGSRRGPDGRRGADRSSPDGDPPGIPGSAVDRAIPDTDCADTPIADSAKSNAPRKPAKPKQSMKIEAGPSAPARSPSRTFTSKVNRSPSTFGAFNTTTASRMIEFFMLVTVQPFFLASPRSAGVKVPTLLSGRAVGVFAQRRHAAPASSAAGCWRLSTDPASRGCQLLPRCGRLRRGGGHDPTRPEQDRSAGQRRESHTWFSPSVWS